MWNHRPDSPINPPRQLGPARQQIQNPSWHHPIDPKQAQNQIPQSSGIRTMKKKMINGFPVPFTHTTPIKNHQPPSSKIIHCRTIPKATVQRKKLTLEGTFGYHTLFHLKGGCIGGRSNKGTKLIRTSYHITYSSMIKWPFKRRQVCPTHQKRNKDFNRTGE
jgi:hypothetical protein